MMVNNLLPTRTFSPRSFMGDRGILLDNLGRVLRSDSLHDEKIIAPKAWKACKSPSILGRSASWVNEEDSFGEAGQEIQTILLQNFNIPSPPPRSDSSNQSPPSPTDDEDDEEEDHVVVVIDEKHISRRSSFSHPLCDPHLHSHSHSHQAINSPHYHYRHEDLHDTLESHFPVFTASPCLSSTPITPPTRSLNPMIFDSSFSHDNIDSVPEGAELGLLSVSPPLKAIFGTF